VKMSNIYLRMFNWTIAMADARASCAFDCSNPGRTNLTQRCKRFTTALKSTTEAVYSSALCVPLVFGIVAQMDFIYWLHDSV